MKGKYIMKKWMEWLWLVLAFIIVLFSLIALFMLAHIKYMGGVV